MSDQDTPAPLALQVAPAVSLRLAHHLRVFLAPLLTALDARLDARLVRTALLLVQTILRGRNRPQGLLLSELGGLLLQPAHAPAGTKRISNLRHSPKWTADLLDQFLWDHADQHRQELRAAGEPALLLWDESVWEKPESQALDGLCAVRSSKAARFKQYKPGFARPTPGPPLMVPGLHWVGVLLAGRSGPPRLAALRWWTNRGPQAQDKAGVQQALLQALVHAWGRELTHIFDRGFAGSPWLGQLLGWRVPFVLRWPKRYHVRDARGWERPAWQWLRGKRAWEQREIWDVRRHCWRKTGVLAMEVQHPDYPGRPLWLVVARSPKAREPWYLLTSHACRTAEEAWTVVFAYARRWQIEQSWRYCKSELSFESVRVWGWETRRKLLLLASLAYAFLLSLLDEEWAGFRAWLLRNWCHRTGQRNRAVAAPLYRVRAAISQLWTEYRPPPGLLFNESPG